MLLSFKLWLENRDWYVTLRYHPFTIAAWTKLRPSIARKLLQQKQFYQLLLNDLKEKTVIDVGANEGFLTAVFSELGFNVVAIEPSNRNHAILKARFHKLNNIKIIQNAVSDHHAKAFFFECDTDPAINTLSEKWKFIGEQKNSSAKLYRNSPTEIATITLDELLKLVPDIGFIKIDVEGHELPVLRGLTRAVPLLSFEAILPYFLEETINCIHHVSYLSDTVRFNYSADYELQLDEFVGEQQFVDVVKSISPQTIEVVCKMV